MVRTDSYLQELNQQDRRGYYLVIQCHDELVFDFPYAADKGNLAKIYRIAALMRQSGDDIGVPLEVSTEYHKESWGEGEKIT